MSDYIELPGFQALRDRWKQQKVDDVVDALRLSFRGDRWDLLMKRGLILELVSRVADIPKRRLVVVDGKIRYIPEVEHEP